MIIYDFHCAIGHRFEGWFASADECDRQVSRGELTCPQCDSPEVMRIPSAAHVHTGSTGRAGAAAESSGPSGPIVGQSNAALDAPQAAEALEKLRAIVMATEDVGREFASEARRIHQQDAPARPIRGVATQGEAKALHEEGIPVVSVPAHLLTKPH